MSFSTILYTILIRPLQLVFEIIFVIALRLVGHPALAVIVLSLAMNLLVLPLYRRADAMQEEARDMDKRLRRGVSHIKKTFSGDEKMMILQTYYRQNHYAPTDSLKGSVSLLLEIPFFIAAYQFLSHATEFSSVSFGPIADLSAPDALLQLGSLSVNLLPILMTLINVVSSAIFLKGFPLRSKIQLYGMALFFLVFLYRSPSGLVFYWTLNNLFSLVKTIFYKIPNPRKVLRVLSSLAGMAAALLGLLYYGTGRPRMMLALLAGAMVLQLPLLLPLLKSRLGKNEAQLPGPDKRLFTLSCLLISILTGLLIPSAVLAAAPTEFINPHHFHHPLLYLLMSGCLAAGSFLLWFRIFYGLANAAARLLFARCLFVLSLLMLANYMFFGTDLGMLSPSLQYEEFWTLSFSARQQLVNLAVLLVLAAAAWLLVSKKPGWARALTLTLCLALGGMSAVNTLSISRAVSGFEPVEELYSAEHAQLPLSRQGKNVIVLMLDRAYGGYLPYFLEEKPELKAQFDGFTWYSNVISFGSHTNFGAPALFGGYEYTPVEMNLREDQDLVSKHNEALSVLPALFYQEGYKVTTCDLPYASYTDAPGSAVTDSYEGLDRYLLKGGFLELEALTAGIENNYRNFFCFSLVKTAPLFLQGTLYYDGSYNQARGEYFEQIIEDDHLAGAGIREEFIAAHDVLCMLPEITVLSEEEKGSLLMIGNETAHDACLLQLPDYRPASLVNNRGYGWESPTVDGQTLQMDSRDQILFYQVNMASLLRIGQWLDLLRELGVYDNTRIILAADHGNTQLRQDRMLFSSVSPSLDAAAYYPLLMVKDYNSHGFHISDAFMTNADVPGLAAEGILEKPVNPFTGKAIDSREKFAHDQYITASADWRVDSHTGNTYNPSGWYAVRDNMLLEENWEYFAEETLLPPMQ